MKILMIGLGSIGQRHLRNLVKVLGEDVEFCAYRTRGLQRTFSDTMKIRDGVNLDKEFNIKVFTDLREALDYRPDMAFVTTITSKHVECTREILERGIDVFIEKPLSDSLDGVSELIRLKNKNNCIAFVGFQNRLNPALVKLNEFVSNEKYGRIISVHAEIGERLTTMHSYENYAETYMARKNMGGGVVLNQMIHELDYLQWMFGMPAEVYARVGKNSDLDIDVEDHCDAIYHCCNNHGDFALCVHADFLQFPPKRSCRVVFEKATVEADIIKNTVTVFKDESEHESFESFSRNDMFIAELKLFLDYIKLRNQTSFTLEEGERSLKMAIGAKTSSLEGNIVKLTE